MKPICKLEHRFVDSFPDKLETGVLYIALDFATMSHLCCCGCSQEVITPMSPKDWKIIFDGETITVHPSIGNWSLPCRSHYFIRDGNIKWANNWNDEKIRDVREQDVFAKRGISDVVQVQKKFPNREHDYKVISFFARIKKFFMGQ